MAHIRCDFSSEYLKMATSLIAILPEQLNISQIPVVYLLHGLTDNCTGWSRYTAVERYAREHGAAVIMPEVQRSYYTDMAAGLSYYSFIQDELPAICQRLFGVSALREKNYIMGLSMGGYGALKCALNMPHRYAGCASFSAVADISARVQQIVPAERMEFQAILGAGLDIPEKGELFALVQGAEVERLPRFFMTCGDQDEFLEGNRRLATLMEARGAQVEFRHWDDGHTWTFWDRSVEMAMAKLLPS